MKYIEYFDTFDKSKIIRLKHMESQNHYYIHLTILREVLEWLVRNWYTILGWEAMIISQKWTLSPVELLIWTKSDATNEEMNSYALNRGYKYFIDTIEKRSSDWEYRKDDVFVDISLMW